MEQLPLFTDPVTRQMQTVEQLQRALRREVARLENLLTEAENGRVGLPTEQADRPKRADIFAR
jgi:hypothetical protein